jgi:23S rRNA-/tRNA-specific pseudouridylate synthase
VPDQAHRLDALTGSILMAARTRPALQVLCAAFAQHKVMLA